MSSQEGDQTNRSPLHTRRFTVKQREQIRHQFWGDVSAFAAAGEQIEDEDEIIDGDPRCEREKGEQAFEIIDTSNR